MSSGSAAKRPSGLVTITSARNICFLGVIREGEGIAVKILRNLGVDLQAEKGN